MIVLENRKMGIKVDNGKKKTKNENSLWEI
jgi:hypothetical protein